MGPQSETDLLVGVPRNQQQSFLINFGVRPGDRTGIRSSKLLAFYDSLHKFNSIGAPEGNQARGWIAPGASDPNLTLPLQAVRTPTIFDALFYTVFPDPGGNISQDYEEPDFAQALFPDYLEAAAPNNELIATRNPASPPYYLAFSGRNGRPGYVRVDAPFTVSGSAFGNYAAEEPATHSTTGGDTLFNLIGMSGREAEFGFAKKELYHSAWSPPGERGRIGYGVKFLSISTLQRLKNTSSNGETIEIRNKPRFEPNFTEIRH